MCFMRDRHVLYHILVWFWIGGGGGVGGEEKVAVFCLFFLLVLVHLKWPRTMLR